MSPKASEHLLIPLPHCSQVVSSLAPLSPPSGRRAQDAWSRVGNWAGGCAAGRGGDRATAAQLQCHPTPPTWPPALPPAQPAGPRAGTTREKRKLFFFPFAKTFSRSCHRRTPAVPAHFPPISFLQAVLEDEVGWLEVREGVPGLWHPQDPQDPPPPLRDPILPTTPPPEHAALGGQ